MTSSDRPTTGTSATGTSAPRPDGRHWLIWLLTAGPLALAYPMISERLPYDGTYLIVAVAAVAATLVGIRRHAPAPRTAWYLIAAGLTLFVAGDVVYTAYASILGEEPPFPGLPDAVYLPGAAGLALGGLALAWRRHRTATTRSLIDAGLVAVSVAVVLWLAVGAETLRGEDATLAVIGVGLAYPLMDATLIGVLAALLLGGQRTSVAVALLMCAFAAFFVTDAIFLTQAVIDAYAVGGLLDAGWLIGYVLIAAAALHPSMASGTTPLPPRLLELSGRHVTGLALPVVLAAASLLAVAHTAAREDPERFLIDLSVLAPAGVVITVLLLWRVASVSNELARTARQRDSGLMRELVVAEVASRLARADTIDEVHRSLEQASELLPGRRRTVELDLEGAIPTSRGTPTAGHRFPLAGGPGASDESEPTGSGDRSGGAAALVATSDEPLRTEHRRTLERLTSDVAMAIDRCQLADELRRSERRFRSLVRHAPDAITVHDADGLLTYASPALGEIVGRPEAELVGIRWAELVHADDAAEGVLDAELVTDPGSTRVVVLRLRHDDGSWRWVETRLTNLTHDPSVGGIVANHRDITERQRLQRQLEHQATHDPLTGVANRRRFADQVRELGAPGSDAVVFLDLDHFKAVNDRLGHAAGDTVLRTVADRLQAGVRPGDVVARLGGDEFAVLLRGTTPQAAQDTAHRLLDAVREPIEIGGEPVTVGASAGLALAEPDVAEPDLLRDADLAMYVAKSSGRGRVERATRQTRERTTQRLSLEVDLRAALADGDLSLRHRPVADLRTGSIIGSQAEIHWVHPTRGDVPADQFLPVAARIGVLDMLSRWAFSEACWSARSWAEDHPDLMVVVPFAGVALRAPGLGEHLDAAMRAAALPGRHLVLQIEGSDLLDRTPAVDDNLVRLRDAGVRIRATNLGTNTPMRVVRDAPVDEVLLSSELVQGLTAGPEEAALGRAVLLLADSFGLGLAADGITTAAQYEALVARGASVGSGSSIGEPVPAGELARMLTASPSTLVAPPG